MIIVLHINLCISNSWYTWGTWWFSLDERAFSWHLQSSWCYKWIGHRCIAVKTLLHPNKFMICLFLLHLCTQMFVFQWKYFLSFFFLYPCKQKLYIDRQNTNKIKQGILSLRVLCFIHVYWIFYSMWVVFKLSWLWSWSDWLSAAAVTNYSVEAEWRTWLHREGKYSLDRTQILLL